MSPRSWKRAIVAASVVDAGVAAAILYAAFHLPALAAVVVGVLFALGLAVVVAGLVFGGRP